MSHFAADVHHRLSTRLSEVIPNFVEAEYPKFVSFLTAYYEFLEQHDELPATSTYVLQPGVVSVRSGNSTILGANTVFANTQVYANNVKIQVGGDIFRIRSITAGSNTELTVYEVPTRTYFANTHKVEVNKSIRQASGALRQLLTVHDIENTLDDFVKYFRDTYLHDIPAGVSTPAVLLPRILDFYQSRGSEESYRFLFRALYGKEVEFAYPRDSVFTTSDNEYFTPIVLRLAANSVTGNASLLETRDIVGLTSNARANILQITEAFEGSNQVIRVFIDREVSPTVVGDILLEQGGTLQATAFGVPPDGLSTQVYTFSFVQEDVTVSRFQSGETISTLPLNDPGAITGTIVGTITGFTINDRGAGYQLNELVYPPGGFGGVGKISQLATVDITNLSTVDPGIGYYGGNSLPLIVDNAGTGGSGLAGYVVNVSPGNITLHSDPSNSNGVSDGDNLAFVYETDSVTYAASREAITYYERGIELSEILTAVIATESGEFITTETPEYLMTTHGVNLNASSWSSNTSSALYGASLSTVISDLTSRLSTFPIYVNGVITELGEVNYVQVESFGTGYVLGVPLIAVDTPTAPTKDVAGTETLTYSEIFGEPFRSANIVAVASAGQIDGIDVVTGGSGYPATAFSVNSTTSSTVSGAGANVTPILGAISYGEPRFRNNKSFASDTMYLQDITKYQPFSYVLTVEEDLYRYRDILKKLVHSGGGLMLPRQTITTELELVASAEEADVELV